MFKEQDSKLVIERLTALWALNECGLGGFMHALGSPFTGILVGGISILLISLIASHATKVWPALIKALSIVLLIKLSVSPHSPITSYVAVSFQAFLGMLLYGIFSVNRITILLLGALTFLESAAQKLLTLTIIYGQSLWEAVDIYSAWVSEKLSIIEYVVSSKTLIILFISFYTCAGILVGLLILRIIKLMKAVDISESYHFSKATQVKESQHKYAKNSKKLILFWMITLLVVMLPLLFFSAEFNGWKGGLYLLARSFLVLVLWYFVMGPLLLKGLNKLLSKHKSVYQTNIQNTLDLFPHLKSIIQHAWQDSSSLKGLNRMQHFMARSIVYSVHFNSSNE